MPDFSCRTFHCHQFTYSNQPTSSRAIPGMLPSEYFVQVAGMDGRRKRLLRFPIASDATFVSCYCQRICTIEETTRLVKIKGRTERGRRSKGSSCSSICCSGIANWNAAVNQLANRAQRTRKWQDRLCMFLCKISTSGPLVCYVDNVRGKRRSAPSRFNLG